MKQDG